MPNGWKPETQFEQHVVDRLLGISMFIESIKVDCGNRLNILMSHDKRLTLLENDSDELPCEKHEERISTIEKNYKYFVGFCAGVVGIVGIAVYIIDKLWK